MVNKKNIKTYLLYAVPIIWAILSFIPILWLISLSFKPAAEWNAFPLTFIPENFTFENYVDIFRNSPMLSYMRNSIIVTGVSLFLSLLLGSLAAYAIARLKFRFKDASYFVIFAVRMIPALLTIIPLYVIMDQLGLLNSLWSVAIAYTATGLPMVVFIMRDYFEAVPMGIEEAAKIDGASRFEIFYRIMLPIVRPGLGVSAIVVFTRTWNEFVVALTLTSSEASRTLPVGLQLVMGERAGEYGPMAAFTIISTIPVIILYLAFQKTFVGGLTQGSIK